VSGRAVTNTDRKSRIVKKVSKFRLDPSTRNLLCQYHSWFALGLLEVSFVHRLSNLLMSIQGNLELSRDEISQGRSVEKYFKDIELAVQTASQYASGIQQTQTKDPLCLTAVNLNQCIHEAIECVNQRWNQQSQITFATSHEVIEVKADSVLMVIMLLELLSVPEAVSVTRSEAADQTRSLSLSLNLPDGSDSTKRASSGVELRIEAKGFRPWSVIGSNNSNDAGQKMHISYEMAKSVMRLFKGEIWVLHPQQLDESVCLYFPIPKHPAYD
jgi:hypothetical protein